MLVEAGVSHSEHVVDPVDRFPGAILWKIFPVFHVKGSMQVSEQRSLTHHFY